MSGVHGHVLGHLVRRGVDAAHAHFQVSPDTMAKLQHDAELYEKTGAEIHDWEMLPVLATAVLTILVLASIKYTIGEVMASLTMIESPTATAIIEDKPPAYADEPDAPLEKEPLMPAEAEADVEVTLINNKPVTSSIRATMKHLKKVGGFRAKWRGLGASVVYHALHSLSTNFLARLLGMGFFGRSLMYILTSVMLARFHMAWTHSMISAPSAKPFWRRMVPRKQCKAVFLPAFVFATAQQATWILPMAVAVALGLPEIQGEHVVRAAQHKDCAMLGLLSLRFLAVPATALFVALAILLPATVTLTRIEALLLSEEDATIVPFDRQALIGDIDLTARGANKKLFVNAWRSFDRAARWRLIKTYVKMAMIQLFVVFTAVHVIAAEMYIIGGERLGVFFKSAAAQIQLEAIDLQNKDL
ncbi:hypothetical protein M409DRAFT_52717 [Zasmidium cellare ATCC 36951]|uniref:Uncharacterized protein n=1 Tax=Zasmidium cellare ATCC 36951 TaxID=1080233 RepID=A0A6A6CUI7_ZASCE|nr:uncharacterized protein M409DRAFT_52717 [Zasmidium cellare ATCC 36951]KAF2169482.1 hypothetical protein M409DRAFT_52717 [Zasmidium cellare ATCC 36951]